MKKGYLRAFKLSLTKIRSLMKEEILHCDECILRATMLSSTETMPAFGIPQNNSEDPAVAFQVDKPDAFVIIDANVSEDRFGAEGNNLTDVKRAR